MNVKSISKLEKKLSSTDLFNLSKSLYEKYNTIQYNSELEYNYQQILSNFIDDSYTNIEMINVREIYNILINKYYNNEISIKANFINNVLFKTKNHVTIFELNSGNSRADICKVNGSSCAFEIKTDLDNFNRLSKQLDDYLLIFEKIYVICSKNKVKTLIEQIPTVCGIYSYSISKNGNYKFTHEKKAEISSMIDSRKQLEILTKKQLENIAKLNLNYTREELISSIINKYSKEKINTLFKETLKNKYKNQWEFITNNHENILEIDYQWFFKNTVSPDMIYK